MKNEKANDGRVSRAAIFFIAFLAAGAILAYFFYPAILSAGGRYLAPAGTGNADAVILEGTEVIKERTVRTGMGLISAGRAKKLVVVCQDSEERPLGLPTDYELFLINKITDLGLSRDLISVLIVPREHPITLHEARLVLSRLSKEKIQSAILVAENFHTRRSYWAYKKTGKDLGIDIIPYPYFGRFKSDSWWQEADGFRNFVGESMKFLYYVFRGHIPIKSLVAA